MEKCERKLSYPDWGSGCYQVSCSPQGLTVWVQNTSYLCSRAGQVLPVSIQMNGWIHDGNLLCPSCWDFCELCPPETDPPAANLTRALPLAWWSPSGFCWAIYFLCWLDFFYVYGTRKSEFSRHSFVSCSSEQSTKSGWVPTYADGRSGIPDFGLEALTTIRPWSRASQQSLFISNPTASEFGGGEGIPSHHVSIFQHI